MVTRDEALAALRGIRPADPPDEVASPTSPAARTILQEVLSMSVTDRPGPAVERVPGPGTGAGGSPPDDLSVALDPFGGRRRRGAPFVAAAAGLAAAALAGVLLVRTDDGGGDRDDDVRAATQPVTIPPMIAGSLPAGTSAYEIWPENGRAEATPAGPVDTRVYGQVADDAVTDDIVIRISEPLPEGAAGMTLGEPVTVRGVDGVLCSPGPQQCDFGNNRTGVSWTEDGVGGISVESRTYDGDQLLAIAEGVVVDGGAVRLGDLPDGVTEVPEVAAVDDDWSWDYAVRYAPADGSGGVDYNVSTRMETDPARRIYDLWLAGPRADAEVQGHPASVDDLDQAFAVTWEAAPGQLVEVTTNGVSEADTVAFAQTVRAATDEEWADLQDQVAGLPPQTETPVDPATERPDDALHRQLADGAGDVWAWIADDGRLCYASQDDGSDVLCTEETDVLGLSPISTNGGPMVWEQPAVVGVAPDGAASIDGGETTLGDEVDGGRLFVWEFVPGEMPDELTFRDADGAVLGTKAVLVY